MARVISGQTVEIFDGPDLANLENGVSRAYTHGTVVVFKARLATLDGSGCLAGTGPTEVELKLVPTSIQPLNTARTKLIIQAYVAEPADLGAPVQYDVGGTLTPDTVGIIKGTYAQIVYDADRRVGAVQAYDNDAVNVIMRLPADDPSLTPGRSPKPRKLR